MVFKDNELEWFAFPQTPSLRVLPLFPIVSAVAWQHLSREIFLWLNLASSRPIFVFTDTKVCQARRSNIIR